MPENKPIIILNKRKGINFYNIIGEITELSIQSKKYGRITFIVDTKCFDYIKNFPWCVRCYRGNFYAYTNNNISLHRLLTDCPKGLFVDHINHNTLDNRKYNLKVCTNKENQHNRKNKFEGIRQTKWGYQVQIKVNNKHKCFGTYKSFDEALKVKIDAEKTYRPYTKEINKYGT